jgi:tripartite-type tricarboxylate transporter receptor subunit TctC
VKPAWLVAACLALTCATSAAWAQEKYPAKPVRIVVPYAPGGATDIAARILGDQLRQVFNQSFVVENKPGANGIVAINELVNSKPDGYTLMLGNVTTNAITPVVAPGKVPNYDKIVTAVSRLVDVHGQRV